MRAYFIHCGPQVHTPIDLDVLRTLAYYFKRSWEVRSSHPFEDKIIAVAGPETYERVSHQLLAFFQSHFGTLLTHTQAPADPVTIANHKFGETRRFHFPHEGVEFVLVLWRRFGNWYPTSIAIMDEHDEATTPDDKAICRLFLAE